MADWKTQKLNNVNIAKELQKVAKNNHYTYCNLNSAKKPQVRHMNRMLITELLMFLLF
jgi:hypothetical protein